MEPAAPHPRGRTAAGSWQWARTAETQRALLDAAREVFTEQGFADVIIWTSLIGEGGREVASARARRQANKVIDAVLEYTRRLMTGGAVS